MNKIKQTLKFFFARLARDITADKLMSMQTHLPDRMLSLVFLKG